MTTKIKFKHIKGGGIVVAYKPQAMTPYQLTLQIKNILKTTEPLGYAGRLDPMAEGLMVILVGEENKKRKEYERLGKTYIFEVLFGVSSDSYDVLGIARDDPAPIGAGRDIQIKVVRYLKGLIGEFEQEYPPYSAKLLRGKPLFKWAREGKLQGIKLPSKIVAVKSAKLLNITTISAADLKRNIIKRVKAVKGEFRQDEVLQSWDSFFEKNKQKEFIVAKIKIDSSSGVYVRSIANDIGEKLGCGAIALNIVRTRVGKYSISTLEI